MLISSTQKPYHVSHTRLGDDTEKLCHMLCCDFTHATDLIEILDRITHTAIGELCDHMESIIGRRDGFLTCDVAKTLDDQSEFYLFEIKDLATGDDRLGDFG